MLGGMLSLYRRHTVDCPHRAKGAAWTRCNCPVHTIGVVAGRSIRMSLRTRNWQRATDMIREMEVRQTIAPDSPAMASIQEACDAAVADMQARKLSSETVRKVRTLTKQLAEFATSKGIRFCSQVDYQAISSFRASWKDGANSATKKLERLREVLEIWRKHQWIPENFARQLKPPKKPAAEPTLPFERDEIVRMIEHLPKLSGMSTLRQRQVLALILVMRYSGLRISDAVMLSRDRVDGKRILLYMEKTKVPVYVPVPDFLVARLEDVVRPDGQYFAAASARPDVVAGNFRRSFRRLGQIAGVANLHPHRFRDTFAVELLNAGVSIEVVSRLLGHSSIRITERHYSPWVKSRQAQLEAAVNRAIAFEACPTTAEFDEIHVQETYAEKKVANAPNDISSLGMVSRVGFEPTTTALKVRCSTN